MVRWHQDCLFWFTIQLKTQGSTWDAALKYSSYFWPSKFWKLTLPLWFNKSKSACPPKCMVDIGKVSLVWQKVNKTELIERKTAKDRSSQNIPAWAAQEESGEEYVLYWVQGLCETQTMFHLYCNGLGRNLGFSHNCAGCFQHWE